MGFHEDLTRHIEAIRNRIPHVKGEEATKHALVVPLLQVLGYDVFDPREIQPEYIADFAKKRPNGQMEKIDYAVRLEGKVAMFVECKAIDAKLEDHDGQLARYFNATPDVKVAVLTNGIRIRVFGDLQQPNIMDSTPWLDVDLLSAKNPEIDALRRFRKAEFLPDQVVALAEEMVYYNAISSLLSTQLREPSESFVRWVASEINTGGRVTAKVVERLAPILQRAVRETILDYVARSLGAPAPAPEPVTQTPEPTKDADAAGGESRDGVETTIEEIKCFESTAEWIREIHPQAAIAYRDSKSYFMIHQNNIRKWWMRMNVQKSPYWVAFRHLQADELKRLAPGFEIIDPAAFGDTRVSLKSVSDFSKLRAAIIAAHEKEAARVAVEAPAAAPSPAAE